MADSAVAVTAGSGTSIDTRTEGTNGNHRQVVVLGDPATNAGVAPVDATNGLSVDVKASALPSGAATSAKQDTIIGHLDGVEGVLTTIDTDTGNIDTKIGDISKAEDAAHSTGDKGVMSLAVRKDTAAALAGTDGDYAPLEVDANGKLHVNTGLTQPTTPADTQPISHAALTELAAAIDTEVQVDVVGALPAGTNNIGDVDILSIAAGDNNIGNVDIASAIPAGTNNIGDVDIASIAAGDNNIGNVDVVTLPGVAGDVAAAAADSGNPVKVGGKYNSTMPTYTDGQRGDVEISSRGAVKTVLYNNDSAVAIAGKADNADAVAVSASATALGAISRNTVYNGTTWDRMRGDTNGTYAQGNVAAAATDAGNPVKVGGKVNSTLPSYSDGQRGDLQLDTRGVLRVVLFGNNSGAQIGVGADNADGSSTSATSNKLNVLSRNTVYNGTSWDRLPGNTTGVFTVPKPTTSGGYTIFRSIDLDETEEDVKTSAGQLYGWYIYNNTASVIFVKLYNATAANVTVGTTTPVMTIPVPANGGTNVEFGTGIAFSTAICAAATTGVADSDTGAPAANALIANFLYA